MISFDTNILVYAADNQAGERHRQTADLMERAIGRGVCVQTLQSRCEFFNVVTRKSGLGPEAAAAFVEGWRQAIPVEPSTTGDLADAMRGVRDHGLAFWDAMLWATARRAGARTLISEDFRDGRVLEGVRIVDRFTGRNAPLVAELLRR